VFALSGLEGRKGQVESEKGAIEQKSFRNIDFKAFRLNGGVKLE